MNDAHTLASKQLRTAGLRSTPQRRAILAAFGGGDSEHLSADEVHIRAAAALPDLGRGTVYATLAEFTEVGLLAAFGTSEPMRYEVRLGLHAHFHCQACMRLFDVSAPDTDPEAFERDGHQVERLDLRAEGLCSQCSEYETGLRAGVRAIARIGASEPLAGRDVAAIELDSPLGPLLVAATAAGVARVAFAEHGDVAFLRGLVGSRAPFDAQGHLDDAREQLTRYFRAEVTAVTCPIDWDVVASAAALEAAMEIPAGSQRSYHLLNSGDGVRELGHIYGANPIPILAPCHRVSRGADTPASFVGGPARRQWLIEHERR